MLRRVNIADVLSFLAVPPPHVLSVLGIGSLRRSRAHILIASQTRHTVIISTFPCNSPQAYFWAILRLSMLELSTFSYAVLHPRASHDSALPQEDINGQGTRVPHSFMTARKAVVRISNSALVCILRVHWRVSDFVRDGISSESETNRRIPPERKRYDPHEYTDDSDTVKFLSRAGGAKYGYMNAAPRTALSPGPSFL